MNGSLTTFYSAKKIKQQECSIIYCSTLNPNRGIITELGEDYFGGQRGEIKKAVVKSYGEINLTLYLWASGFRDNTRYRNEDYQNTRKWFMWGTSCRSVTGG